MAETLEPDLTPEIEPSKETQDDAPETETEHLQEYVNGLSEGECRELRTILEAKISKWDKEAKPSEDKKYTLEDLKST